MDGLGASLRETKERIESFFDSFMKDPTSETSAILISPWTVKKLGDILGVNVSREGNQVPNLKTFLRVFLLQYRLEQEIKPEEIECCLDMILQERIKRKESSIKNLPAKPGNPLGDGGQIFCVECGLDAERYCVDCNEASCVDCCGRLHAKGNRAKHILNTIIPCSLCRGASARLLCTYTFRCFCVDCYSRRHAKSIPHEMLDLKPVEIDYTLRSTTPHVPSLQYELIETTGSPSGYQDKKRILAPGESDPLIDAFTVGRDWHPFIDSSGVAYYYNFVTQESMRRASSGVGDTISQEQREARLKIATFLSQTV